MRHYVYIILVLLSGLSMQFAQVNREWVQRYNGAGNSFDIVNSMKLDNSSNVYISGSTASQVSQTDILMVKYSSSGNMIWSSLFNGYANSVDNTNSFFLDNSGNIYVTGYTADTNFVIKMVTLKLDNDGNIEWSRVLHPPQYFESTGYYITQCSDNSIAAAGNFRKLNGTYDVVLVKYNSYGVMTDSIVYDTGLQNSESVTQLYADALGNIYLFGSFQEQGSFVIGLVMKLDVSLNPVWSRLLRGTSQISVQPVQMTADNSGRLIVCMAVPNTSSGMDYGIFKLDTNSQVLARYSYNGTGNDQDIPYAVTTDAQNNILVTGSSRNADTLGSEDIVTIKLNSDAQLIWGRSYNGPAGGIDYGTAITCDNSGNIYIGGAIAKHSIHLAYALLKYNHQGDLLWMEQYSRIHNSEDFVYSVAADNNSNVFVTGISFDSLSDFDIATIKYSQAIGIQPIGEVIPRDYSLEQNYPNPFNPQTRIRFSIPLSGLTEVKIYNALGIEAAELLNEELEAGVFEITWNAAALPSGIYFCRIRSGNFSKTNKMIFVK